jgi:hypothetical protein
MKIKWKATLPTNIKLYDVYVLKHDEWILVGGIQARTIRQALFKWEALYA